MNSDVNQSYGTHPTVWSHIWRLFRRVGFAGAALFAAFLLIGYLYEQSALRRIESELPPRGKRVAIGDRYLHLDVKGSGGPTVIFETGLGANCIAWDLVAPKVSESTRVVTYDRAGLGWSDPIEQMTASTVVDDLQTALRNEQIAGPYLLVGHSIGGLYVRLFSYRNQADVAGIVLVDSSHEDQFDELSESMRQSFDRMGLLTQLASYSATFGIPRMLVGVIGDPTATNQLSEGASKANQMLLPSQNSLWEIHQEFENLRQIGYHVHKEHTDWGDLPLTVLTAGKPIVGLPEGASQEAFQEKWFAYHRELASRSTSSKHRIVKGSAHNIQAEQPQVVIDEILSMVKAIRSAAQPSKSASTP